MLRSEVKEGLLLLFFVFFLSEVLTYTTIGFVLLGVVLVALRIKPSRFLRNTLAVGILASYWMTYGKVIDPEVGLNFLTTIIVLKLLEKDSLRDQYMIFFGLILLISAGSLFEKNLTYVLFFGVSFFVLIQNFYTSLQIRSTFKELRKAFIWVIPLTVILFFFIPRVLNPLPYQSGSPSPGEVGYTPSVNIAELGSLSSNDRPVFQVLVPKELFQEGLYWRGNTISFTDGWNWINMPQDQRSSNDGDRPQEQWSAQKIKQKIRSFYREEFFFALDVPVELRIGNSTVTLSGPRTKTQKRWQWFQRYEVLSAPQGRFINQEEPQIFLRTSLSQNEEVWINRNFQGKTIDEISQELERFFYQRGFQYSLSPGPVISFMDFMTVKRIGLCSHYASALGLILRVKKIPARLVSGFMGGTYNRYAKSYLITQNDAHVWVEALESGYWRRLDPTVWIAPDRVSLGGEAFIAKVSGAGLSKFKFLSGIAWIRDLQQWFTQWDFSFYQWLENMDYYAQESWLIRFKLGRKWFLAITPVLILLFVSIYFWQVLRGHKRQASDEIHLLWIEFQRRMEKKGLRLNLVGLKEQEQKLRELKIENKDEILRTWEDLVNMSFKASRALKINELKKRIKKL